MWKCFGTGQWAEAGSTLRGEFVKAQDTLNKTIYTNPVVFGENMDL